MPALCAVGAARNYGQSGVFLCKMYFKSISFVRKVMTITPGTKPDGLLPKNLPKKSLRKSGNTGVRDAHA
jgi:hypothetical protein